MKIDREIAHGWKQNREGGVAFPFERKQNGMFEKNPPCNGVSGSSGCNPRELYGLEGKSLAMVYCPKQYWRMLYSAEEALRHGTLFEELHKPLEARGADGEGESRCR